MSIIPSKTPGFITRIFPQFVWRINTERKVLYLTFDDGPTPEITNWVLQLLKSYNAKATFFCIGKNIREHSDIFAQIIEQGHTVGNHTYNHLKGWKTHTISYLKDIEATQDLIDLYLPNISTDSERHETYFPLFRPPYGKFKFKQAKQILEKDFKVILWDVLSFDWDKNLDSEVCYNKVIQTATSGSIVVFHDSKKAEKNLKAALPKVLNYFQSQGFKFESLDSKKILE